MPVYCYQKPDKTILERWYRIGDAPKTIKIKEDGKLILCVRCLSAEIISQHGFVKGSNNPVIPRRKTWPLKCVASGVHPSQAQELRDHYKKHGLNIHVDSDGDPHYEDAQQRRKALKCRGMHDRNDHFG